MATYSQAPSTPGIVFAKDYSLINLTMLTAVDTIDLKSILTELSYHEDLFGSTASGYLMIVDSMGYIENLNLNGNEYIRMTFGKTSDNINWIDKLFRVYKVDKRKPEGSGSTESYSFYFCSEELLLSEQYKVSKSYSNSTISTNIIDILNNYLKVPAKKIGTIEATTGVYDFIVPNIKPFDAINWMSTYARPATKNLGADMVFFEDKVGFNFRSIQSLMSGPVYHNYSYSPKNLDKKAQPINSQVYNVTTYEIMDSYDSLGAINSGMFANQLISVDVLTRSYKATNFNYTNSVKPVLNPNQISNNLNNRFGNSLNQTPQAVLKLVFSNFNENDSSYIKEKPGSVAHNIYAETYIPYRTAQMALYNYMRVKISVPGDPGLTVGQVIGFSLLSKNPNQKEPDNFYSGNYLITAVRHMISMSEYKTVIEIAKESTVKPYVAVDNTSGLWKNSVQGII